MCNLHHLAWTTPSMDEKVKINAPTKQQGGVGWGGVVKLAPKARKKILVSQAFPAK